MKPKKGQGSLEYILLVAGAIFLVLIIVVVVRQFFFNPGASQVVSQGSIVQQQFGSLSKSLEKGKPLSYRNPKVYGGLIQEPVTLEYGLQACVRSIEFWSNLSGNFELTKTIAEKHDPEIELYGASINVSDEISEPGFYEFNIRTCACEGICEWLYADENGTQINQVIEIVAQGNAEYQAAKAKADHDAMCASSPFACPSAPQALETSTNIGWTCDLGVPLIEGSATVKGTDLTTVQLKCDINGRRIENQLQNIQRSGQYRVRILDQNAQGQSTCYTTACNSTECIESEHRNYPICQPQDAVPNIQLIEPRFESTQCNPQNCLWTYEFQFNYQNIIPTRKTLRTYNQDGTPAQIIRAGVGLQNQYTTAQNPDQSLTIAVATNAQDRNDMISNYYWSMELCDANGQCVSGQPNMQIPQPAAGDLLS